MDLATLKRTSIGSLALQGVTRSQEVQQRWLARDAVDAIVQEPIFGAADPKANATGYRVYLVRVPGVAP